ncbi:MAG TPA: hypothetical protein VKT22_03805 [Steroidobacteraceae bacterium]|nr:hypothetical protein [Steroidobacteraceae bacterium]
MPIYECDPWREQYFAHVECPPDVHIPTDDVDAWRFNPAHRFIYDKLRVARSQGIECGPYQVPPPHYPVFCKPIINLKGMGAGSCVLRNTQDYRERCRPQDFWMTLLTGEHISTDWAVVEGEPMWCRHTRGIPGKAATFDYWIIQARPRPALESYCAEWIRRHLRDYTGMVNIETIGGRIIELHLRFADQWPDLYGAGWLEAVVRLYRDGVWQYADLDRRDGYSVVLFGPHGLRYAHPSRESLAAYRATPGVSSVQITFFEDLSPDRHIMPPGGFRLAVINCVSFAAGVALRSTMARDFGFAETSRLALGAG